MDEVFVYGTLKYGHGNNHFLGESRFITEASTVPSYRLYEIYQDGFPCMVPDENGVSVKGEIYQVTPKTLELLDLLEGVPRLYRRERVKFVDFDREAWVYIYNGEVNKDLDCGSEWPTLESIQRKDQERWTKFHDEWRKGE